MPVRIHPLLIFIFLVFVGCQSKSLDRQSVIVGSAISLRQPLQAIAEAFEGENPEIDVIFQFASSGSLRFQIENGAPIDAFLSAHPLPMEKLVERGVINAETIVPFLENRMALAWSPSGTAVLKQRGLNPDFPSLANPAITRIALGEPKAVPAGIYGRQVLKSLTLWDAVQGKSVFTKDALQIVTYLANDHVQAGLLYQTDIRKLPPATPFRLAPPESHEPIQYLLAPVNTSPSPAATQFLDYLQGAPSGEIFSFYGFSVE